MHTSNTCSNSCPSMRYSPYELYAFSFNECFQDEFSEVSSYSSILNLAKEMALDFTDNQLYKYKHLLENLEAPEKEGVIEMIHSLQCILNDSKKSLSNIQADGLVALDTIYRLARQRSSEISNTLKRDSEEVKNSAASEHLSLVQALESDHGTYIEKLTTQYCKASKELASWHENLCSIPQL